MPSEALPHEYGPSRVGHGEAQCKWCHGTNRENAIIAPNHCDARPKPPADSAGLRNEAATTITAQDAEIARLREALEPFAAFARAAESIRIFSGQTVANTKIIQSVAGEGGVLGVLLYGHVLDALAAFNGRPKGYDGTYRNLRAAIETEHG